MLTTKYLIFIVKNVKRLPKILNTLRCDMVTSFEHYNDVTDRRAAVRFLSFPRVGTGFVRWVKKEEIAIWCALKHQSGERIAFLPSSEIILLFPRLTDWINFDHYVSGWSLCLSKSKVILRGCAEKSCYSDPTCEKIKTCL